MTALRKHRWTEQEYLAFDRTSASKHEYYDGEIYNMVGGSSHHALIAANAIIALGSMLGGHPCRVYTGDLRVKMPESFVYPDVTVVCGEPRFLDSSQDTLLNPTLVIEVLSPSTAAFDRGAKLHGYQTLESLQMYLLVEQDRAQVELYTRRSEGWLYTRYTGLESTAALPALEISLPLAALYDKVDFAAQEDERA
jgi:Uma2 family endonuclease